MTFTMLYKSRFVAILLPFIAFIHWNIGVVASQDPLTKSILCNLPLLSHSGYVSEQGLIFYWNLCPDNGVKLVTLNPKCGSTEDGGDVCVTKVNHTTKSLEAYVPNSGKLSGAKLVAEGPGHLSILLDHGLPCNNGLANYSTRFDFFCNDGEPEKDPQQSIMHTQFSHQCNFSLFWYTSLACSPDKLAIEELEKKRDNHSCKIYIPIYDQKLDLKTLNHKIGYSVNVDAKHFQLNICGNVRNFTCSSPLCEMDGNGKVKRTIFPKNKYNTTTSFNEQSNVLNFKYTGEKEIVSLDLSCMEQGENNDPDITYIEEKSGTNTEANGQHTFFFKVRTRHVCMHPSTSCETKDPVTGVTYDLSPLMTSNRDWLAYDTRPGESNRRYHLSVCKPLSPSSTNYECQNSRTAICQTNENSKESSSLGIVSSGIVFQPQDENSLIINYKVGSRCNAKRNHTSSITFRCYDIELGPKFVAQNDDCHFLFEWLTPVACPKEKITKKNDDCMIRDPVSGYIYDLNRLYNPTIDYEVKSDTEKFKINVCNDGLHSQCEDQARTMGKISVCKEKSVGSEAQSLGFMSNGKLEYNNAGLMMKYEGSSCTKSANYTSMILFVCDYYSGTGKPNILETFKNACEYFFTWKTSLACSFRETECITSDKDNNIYDLTSLTLAKQDYEISSDEGTKYLINVCRSHVTLSSNAKCPSKAAVCYGKLQKGSKGTKSWKYINAGQVVQGPKIDEYTKDVILEYKMGDICEDSATSEAHVSSRILIKCERGTLHSQPEFESKVGCAHNFLWLHDAACPKSTFVNVATAEEHCKVKDNWNGNVYDFNSLTKEEGQYEFVDRLGRTYSINICGPIKEGINNIGARLEYKSGTKSKSLGKYNGIVTYNSQQQLSLNYSGGDQCNENESYSTLIRFICIPHQKTPKMFVEMSTPSMCGIFVNFFTSLACPQTISCLVPNSEFDLSPLMNYNENYKIQNSNVNEERGVMSICKSLVVSDLSPSIRETCPLDSAMCLGNSKIGFQSFGIPSESPRLNNGDIVLTYTNGSVCKDPMHDTQPNKKGQTQLRMSSTITFKCDYTEPLGFPSVDDAKKGAPDKCHREFIWKTLIACKNRTKLDVKRECHIYHPILKTFVDFSKLSPSNNGKKPFVVKGMDSIRGGVARKKTEYLIDVCNSPEPGCGGSICMRGNEKSKLLSMGNIKKYIYSFDHDELIVHYTNGDRCEAHGAMTNYSAEIHFECDKNMKPSDIGKPVMFVELPCHPVFNWKTSLVCDKVNSKMPSSKSQNGTFLVVSFIIVAAVLVIAFFWNPQRREKVRQAATNVMQHLRRSNSRTDETNLLVTSNVTIPTFDDYPSNGMAFGRLSDEDDDELIIA